MSDAPVKKRRGRPPKVKPEGVDASPGLTAAPVVDHVGECTADAPQTNRFVSKPKRPSAPILAREVVDFLLERYDWEPGDWRVVLTTLALVGRLGGYWSQQTRKR